MDTFWKRAVQSVNRNLLVNCLSFILVFPHFGFDGRMLLNLLLTVCLTELFFIYPA